MRRRTALAALTSSFAALAVGATAAASAPPGSGAGESGPNDTQSVDSAASGTIPDPAACAEGLTLEEGVLTIATGEPAYPPYVIDDDPTSGEGFESAVAYAVAAQLGFEPEQVEWVRTTFEEGFAPGLKDFDFNLQQYDITPERQETVSFSLPYYTSNQAIVGPSDSAAAGAASLSDLQALRFGVAAGTTSLAFVEEIIQPEAEVQVYNDNDAAVAALGAQQIDALVADLPTALYVAAAQLDDGAVFGQFQPTDVAPGSSFGLLFEKDNPLVECVDNAILSLRQSGELDAITAEWMSSSIEVPFLDIDG